MDLRFLDPELKSTCQCMSRSAPRRQRKQYVNCTDDDDDEGDNDNKYIKKIKPDYKINN